MAVMVVVHILVVRVVRVVVLEEVVSIPEDLQQLDRA
jgi:hypothetical protein